MNFGIVVTLHLFPPSVDMFTDVAVFMLVVSAVGLIVGSEVSERHRMGIHLHQQTTYLDSLIQNSPLAMVALDRQGSVELVNSAFEKLFRYDRNNLASIEIRNVQTPDGEAWDSAQVIAQILAGKCHPPDRTASAQRWENSRPGTPRSPVAGGWRYTRGLSDLRGCFGADQSD